MMTLKQSFTIWSSIRDNIKMSAKYRDAVQKVLLKRYANTDLSAFTPEFTRQLFADCPLGKSLKVKAASTLVQILQWGAQNGHCEQPAFTWEIFDKGFNPDVAPPSFKVNDDVGSQPSNDHSEIIEDNNNYSPKKEENMNTEVLSDKQPKAVVQIDLYSLQPLKRFPSRFEAEKETGIKNIRRAIALKGKAGGYFWCYAGEEQDFKTKRAVKKPVSGKQPKKVVKKCPEKKEVTEVPSVTPQQRPLDVHDILSLVSNEELAAEIKRRGWTGSVTFQTSIVL